MNLNRPLLPPTASYEDPTMNYPIELNPDDDGSFIATFPDVPGAITYGSDRDEAVLQAADALETMLAAIIAARGDIPSPSPACGRPTAGLGLLAAMKVAVYQAMRARGWRKADLARELAVNPRQVDRLLNLRHASTVGQLAAALSACGRTVRVELEAPPSSRSASGAGQRRACAASRS